jgi:hypothetical protein
VRVITNGVPRPLLDPAELTEREREEFDYLDWAAIDDGRDSAMFVRYRGRTHDLGQFMHVNPGDDLDRAGWHGFHADSAFSATLVRFMPNGDHVVMGLGVI